MSLVHISFVDQIIPPLYQLTDGERERGRQIYPRNEILGRFCRNLWPNNQTNKWPGHVTSPRSDSSAASHCRGELESPEGLRGKGASIYDVRNNFGFFDPLPPVSVTNQLILFLFVCFLGTPLNTTHCGRHIWKPPNGTYSEARRNPIQNSPPSENPSTKSW